MERIVDANLARQKKTEKDLFEELKKAYQDIERALMDEADKVLDEIEKRPNLVYHQGRVETLLMHVRREMQKYADDVVVPRVAQGMVQSSYLGSEQARAVLNDISTHVFTATELPAPAIDAFIRHLNTGPLGKLFDSFGDEAAAKARTTLLKSITLGHNPRKTASELKKTLGINRNRALLIARTETMRAHREGNRQTYKANGIQKWVWHAAMSGRTCAACFALHGREFDIDEPMGAHPACRCTMVPKPQTWRQMGFEIEGDSVIEDGETEFAKQPAKVQQQVLGDVQYKRYKQGEVTLEDFIAVKNSPYGKTYTKKIPS